MSDPRDPAIKLFGRSIVPLEEQPPTDFSGTGAGAGAAVEDVCAGVKNKEFHALKPDAPKEVDQNEPANSSGASNSNEEDHHMSTVDANTEQDRAMAQTSNQEKALKKPDKILPCPRCKSLDTKFCYFNNYNVNQPRHFCKNCHRYWTAGGTMRNVPVGAGKRKSKVSTSHHHHTMMVADGMPLTDSAGSVALSGASSVHLRPLKEKAPVQSFRPEAPVSESVVSAQADQKRNTEIGSCGENTNESLCLSSLTDSHHVEDDSTVNTVPNGQSAIHHLPCYPGPPFVFPWSPGCNSAAAMAAGWCSSDVFNGSGNVNSNPVAWSQPPTFPSAFCAPNFAFPLMPASFWGCMSSWPPGAWNIPWIGSNGHVTPALSTHSCDSATTLGKHYRDAPLEGEGERERRTKSLWAPKTLRIDDPDEAVKSSIWDTLGIKPEKLISKGSVFKAFQSKSGTKAQTTDATHVMHANPVALCRSQKFQESN